MGWTFNEDQASGAFFWNNPNFKTLIYASPDWNEDGFTSICIDADDGGDCSDGGEWTNDMYFAALMNAILNVTK